MSVAQETATGAVVLRTEHLGRRAGDVSIVTDVSLEVYHGEMLGIVGASGSGKSSLLRLLNRLDEPTAGTVFLDGQDYRQFSPRELRRRVGMVTQRPFLFPGNVASNIRFGPLQRDEVLADEGIARLLDGSACLILPGAKSRTYPVVNSNGFRSRERSPTIPRSYCWTSQRRHSMNRRRWASNS